LEIEVNSGALNKTHVLFFHNSLWSIHKVKIFCSDPVATTISYSDPAATAISYSDPIATAKIEIVPLQKTIISKT
jgi:hypothetical protein